MAHGHGDMDAKALRVDKTETCGAKQHRRKSYEWILAIDNQILAVTGRGLEQFKPVGPAEGWPKLSITTDQGSDAMCGWSYLAFRLKLNINQVPDLSHGVYNDLKSHSRSKKLVTVRLMCLG